MAGVTMEATLLFLSVVLCLCEPGERIKPSQHGNYNFSVQVEPGDGTKPKPTWGKEYLIQGGNKLRPCTMLLNQWELQSFAQVNPEKKKIKPGNYNFSVQVETREGTKPKPTWGKNI